MKKAVIVLGDVVKIKGLKSGLQLSFANGATFDEVKENLLDKLQTGNSFFVRGTTVYIPKDFFPEAQNEALRKMFHQHGMLFSTDLKRPNFAAPSKDPAPDKNEPLRKMMIVNRTIRGGEEIRTQASILICGNVNPGAQVIADGSIDIRGTCRGMVHAGAAGDETAFVVADKLMPVQIRIANYIARSPDEPEQAEHAERASVKNGQIIFEPVSR